MKTNSLQMEGKPPFHLKLNVQIYDLQGVASEQGSVEYWWAGASGFHLDITTPSLGTVHNTSAYGVQSDAARRSLYLITDLLDSVRFGGRANWPAGEPVMTEDKTVEKMALRCTFQKQASFDGSRNDVCVDPATGMVRVAHDGVLQIVKNRGASFAGTRVAIATGIYCNGRELVSGTIVALEGFSPATAKVELEGAKTEQKSAPATGRPIVVSGSITGGYRVAGPAPIYPDFSRQQHATGSVVMVATITKQGTVTDLITIASPNQLLTGSAEAAVRKWTYRPYLLNGSPVEVSTTITVNFNLDHAQGAY